MILLYLNEIDFKNRKGVCMMINLWEYLNNFIYFIFLGDDLICIVVRNYGKFNTCFIILRELNLEVLNVMKKWNICICWEIFYMVFCR